MQRILFVDDEPKLLSGLRRMLHGQRGEWAMEFAESGREALERLAEQPFDVVVSDMRMPGMDGSDLLRHVRQRHPATVRMILSGQCDRLAVLKAVGPAHQFLTKPCNSETLKGAIGRACRLRDRMPAPAARELVSRVEAIPSLPESLSKLAATLDDSSANAERVGRIVAADPGMAARVLQLVNSGFYGSPQPMVDPCRAAGLLGSERLAELVGSTEAFTAIDLPEASREPFADTVDHSRAVAEAAGRIARAESDRPELAAEARWAGLLHDVGALAILHQAPDRYADLSAASNDRDDICRHERRAFGADHAAMGAYLLALWGLPNSMVRVAALHHTPGEAGDAGFTALTAVHAANVFLRNAADAASGRRCSLDYPYLERIGKTDRVAVWTELCNSVRSQGAMA